MKRLDDVVGLGTAEADVIAIDVEGGLPGVELATAATVIVVVCDGLGPVDRGMGSMVEAR